MAFAVRASAVHDSAVHDIDVLRVMAPGHARDTLLGDVRADDVVPPSIITPQRIPDQTAETKSRSRGEHYRSHSLRPKGPCRR